MEIKSQEILSVFNSLQISGKLKKLSQRDQASLYIAANEAVLVQLRENRGEAVEDIDRPNWREVMLLNEARSDEDMREDENDASLQATARTIFDDNNSVLLAEPVDQLEGTFGPLTEYSAFYAEEALCNEAESMIENSRDFASNWATAVQRDQAFADYYAMKAEYTELFANHELWRRALVAAMPAPYSE